MVRLWQCVDGGVFISLIQFPGFVPQSNGFVHHSECICIRQWMYLCVNVEDLLGGRAGVGGFVNHRGGICIPMSCRWGADRPHLSSSQIWHFQSLSISSGSFSTTYIRTFLLDSLRLLDSGCYTLFRAFPAILVIWSNLERVGYFVRYYYVSN